MIRNPFFVSVPVPGSNPPTTYAPLAHVVEYHSKLFCMGALTLQLFPNASPSNNHAEQLNKHVKNTMFNSASLPIPLHAFLQSWVLGATHDEESIGLWDELREAERDRLRTTRPAIPNRKRKSAELPASAAGAAVTGAREAFGDRSER